MAKGNLFQGMARGKVGDVVLSRLDGQQVSRVRNRNPKNPKTRKQMVQRAIAANIQRLYSLGYDILDHSFEGQAVGRGNQRAFAKKNMKILRNLVVADLNAGSTPAECVGRVGLPGISVGVPFVGMQVSSGKLNQRAFSLSPSGNNGTFMPTTPDAGFGDMTVPQWLASVGAQADDIFTFIVFRVPTATGAPVARITSVPLSDYADLWNTIFTYAQLKVKASAESSALTMAAATIADVFDIVGAGIDGTDILNEGILVSDVTQASEIGDACLCACIMSRENEGVRSTETLELVGPSTFGISSYYIEDGWQEGGAVIDGAELILEGENF